MQSGPRLDNHLRLHLVQRVSRRAATARQVAKLELTAQYEPRLVMMVEAMGMQVLVNRPVLTDRLGSDHQVRWPDLLMVEAQRMQVLAENRASMQQQVMRATPGTEALVKRQGLTEWLAKRQAQTGLQAPSQVQVVERVMRAQVLADRRALTTRLAVERAQTGGMMCKMLVMKETLRMEGEVVVECRALMDLLVPRLAPMGQQLVERRALMVRMAARRAQTEQQTPRPALAMVETQATQALALTEQLAADRAQTRQQVAKRALVVEVAMEAQALVEQVHLDPEAGTGGEQLWLFLARACGPNMRVVVSLGPTHSETICRVIRFSQCGCFRLIGAVWRDQSEIVANVGVASWNSYDFRIAVNCGPRAIIIWGTPVPWL